MRRYHARSAVAIVISTVFVLLGAPMAAVGSADPGGAHGADGNGHGNSSSGKSNGAKSANSSASSHGGGDSASNGKSNGRDGNGGSNKGGDSSGSKKGGDGGGNSGKQASIKSSTDKSNGTSTGDGSSSSAGNGSGGNTVTSNTATSSDKTSAKTTQSGTASATTTSSGGDGDSDRRLVAAASTAPRAPVIGDGRSGVVRVVESVVGSAAVAPAEPVAQLPTAMPATSPIPVNDVEPRPDGARAAATAEPGRLPVWVAAPSAGLDSRIFGLAGLVLMPLAGMWLGYRQARAHRDAEAASLRVIPDGGSFPPRTSESPR